MHEVLCAFCIQEQHITVECTKDPRNASDCTLRTAWNQLPRLPLVLAAQQVFDRSNAIAQEHA